MINVKIAKLRSVRHVGKSFSTLCIIISVDDDVRHDTFTRTLPERYVNLCVCVIYLLMVVGY